MVKWIPRDYQDETANLTVAEIEPAKGQALFLDPGLGKTSITLQVFKTMAMTHGVKKMLIIAPLRVCYSVWRQEAQKWDQFKSLQFSLIHGSVKQRTDAIKRQADIYLCPISTAQWMVDQYEDGLRDMFDVLVIDESSQIKSHKSVRFKKCKFLATMIPYRMILSGTPTPHSLHDLWSQIYILDFGKRLGKNVTTFRNEYCTTGGFRGHSFKVVEAAKPSIMNAIKDVSVSLRAADHLKMPPITFNTLLTTLPPKVQELYNRFEDELFATLDTLGHDGELIARGTTYVKCRQIANGAVYLSSPDQRVRDMRSLHTEKVKAIAELIDELSGKPAIIAYSYDTDLMQLRQTLGANTPAIRGGMDPNDVNKTIDQWNAGEIDKLLVQPQSLSHGVNMQSGPGRDIIWMQPPDMGEVFTQLNARLWRSGVDSAVRIHIFVTSETVDVASNERLGDKLEQQESLLNALRRYRDSKKR